MFDPFNPDKPENPFDVFADWFKDEIKEDMEDYRSMAGSDCYGFDIYEDNDY